MGVALGATAIGIMGVASALGDAVGSAIRQRAYLARVDALTREAVRQNLADNRKRAASKALAQDLLRQTAIAAYNRSLKEAA
jgi:hypothetical protein